MSEVLFTPTFDPPRAAEVLHALRQERFDEAAARFKEWIDDALRVNVMGLPALHARFTGPTPRKHYSRRERRRRRWL